MIEDVSIKEFMPDGSLKPIKGANDDPNNHHNILVGFDVIVDLDFAILRMVQAEYNNPKFINQRVMRTSSKNLKYLLVNRRNPNPLTICIEDKKLADSIYDEIMEKRYNDLITKYHSNTGIFFMMSTLSNLDNYTIIILCQNEQEESIVNYYDKNIKCIVVKDFTNDIKVKDYTMFFFKDKYDILKFNQPFFRKHVFIMKYRFNVIIDGNEVLPDVEMYRHLHTTWSELAVIDIYSTKDPDYATILTNSKKVHHKPLDK